MILKQSHLSKFGEFSVRLHTCFTGTQFEVFQPLLSLFNTAAKTSNSKSIVFTPFSFTFNSVYASHIHVYNEQSVDSVLFNVDHPRA